MEFENSIQGRISWILEEFFQGNKSKMSSACGTSASVISQIVLGRDYDGKGNFRKSEPGFKLLEALAIQLKGKINTYWLLTGEGNRASLNNVIPIDEQEAVLSKLRKLETESRHHQETAIHEQQKRENYEAMLESKDAVIAHQADLVEVQKQQNRLMLTQLDDYRLEIDQLKRKKL